MPEQKAKPVICYLAVPVKTAQYPGADESRLKQIFASMDKYYAPGKPVGKSWLIREKPGNPATDIVGKAYAIQVELTKAHKEEIRRTGAIIQAEEPVKRPELQVTPHKRERISRPKPTPSTAAPAADFALAVSEPPVAEIPQPLHLPDAPPPAQFVAVAP